MHSLRAFRHHCLVKREGPAGLVTYVQRAGYLARNISGHWQDLDCQITGLGRRPRPERDGCVLRRLNTGGAGFSGKQYCAGVRLGHAQNIQPAGERHVAVIAHQRIESHRRHGAGLGERRVERKRTADGLGIDDAGVRAALGMDLTPWHTRVDGARLNHPQHQLVSTGHELERAPRHGNGLDLVRIEGEFRHRHGGALGIRHHLRDRLAIRIQYLAQHQRRFRHRQQAGDIGGEQRRAVGAGLRLLRPHRYHGKGVRSDRREQRIEGVVAVRGELDGLGLLRITDRGHRHRELQEVDTAQRVTAVGPGHDGKGRAGNLHRGAGDGRTGRGILHRALQNAGRRPASRQGEREGRLGGAEGGHLHADGG